jgi:hypothetical protein
MTDQPAGTPTNAIRTESKTGGAKDVKIQRYDQIPAGPLAELAARYGIGSLKYPQRNGLDNWRNGYPWSYSYRALLGHANDFWRGEDVDPNAYLGTFPDESSYDDDGPRPGVTHLAAVAWHALALLEWAETHPEYDDRPSTVVRRNAAGLSGLEDFAEVKPGDEPTADDRQDYASGVGEIRFTKGDGIVGELLFEHGQLITGPPDRGEVGALSDLRHQVTSESITSDGWYVRTHLPNAEIRNDDGSFTAIGTLTPERPLAIGTRVIYLVSPGDDPVEGVIEAVQRLDFAASYLYDVRVTHYQHELTPGLVREQLYIQA